MFTGLSLQECGKIIKKKHPDAHDRFYENHTNFGHHVMLVILDKINSTHSIPIISYEFEFCDGVCVYWAEMKPINSSPDLDYVDLLAQAGL